MRRIIGFVIFSRLSDSEPPMDLRHRVESKRAERERHEREVWDDDRSDTPPVKVSKLQVKGLIGYSSPCGCGSPLLMVSHGLVCLWTTEDSEHV